MAKNLAVALQIDTQGAPKALSDFLAIQEAIKRTALASEAAARAYASQSSAIASLSQSLGGSYKNNRDFAKSLGITAEAAGRAVDKLHALDRAGATTAEKYRALRTEFGLTRAAFESLNGAFNQNTQAQQRLAGSLSINLDAAQQFAKGLGLSASQADTAVGRYRELTGVGATLAEKQRVLTQELGLTKSQFEAVAKAAATTQAGLASVAAISGGAAAAAGMLANRSMAEFMEFDSALRQFGVIAEATPGKVAEIRSEIERLGTTTTKTPKEVGALAIELAKAGFTAAQVKDGLGGVVLASQATGEDLARTGEVIGNVINQFGLTAKDSNRIADLLVVTSNKSASGINDLGEALSYAGTASKESGQSLEDTLLALGQLANAGIKGSSAGTGLAEALRRLKLASANASTELQDLRSKGSKSAVAAFRKIDNAVRDASGQLLPLPKILENLKAGMEGVGQVDRDLINNALFGVQGGRVIQSLLGSNIEQLGQLKDGLANADGAAQRAGQALSEGPAAGLQRLQAASSVALARVGELVSVAFLPLIDAGELLINTFNSLPGPLQMAVVGVGGLAAALAAATAAIAAYKLSNAEAIVAQTLAAAATVKDTAAKGLNLAATVGLAGAQKAGAVVSAAYAVATGTVTAAQVKGVAVATATALATGREAAAKSAAIVATKALAVVKGILAAATAAYAVASGQATIATVAGGTAASAAATKFAAMGAAIGAVLLPLAALGAAVAAANLAKLAEQIGDVNDALEQQRVAGDVAASAGVAAQQKLKSAADSLSDARKLGLALSEQEKKEAQEALKRGRAALDLMRQQLAETEKLPKAQAGMLGLGKEEAEAQNRAREMQINGIKAQIAATERQQAVVKEGQAGEAARVKALGEDKARLLREGLAAEIATLEAGQESVRLLQLQGHKSDIEAEMELSRLKQAELAKRIEANAAAVAAETDAKKKGELQAEGKALASERARAVVEGEQRVQSARFAEVDRAEKRATEVLKSAEIQRQTEIQRLVNQGAITKEQAEQRKLQSARLSLEAELAANRQQVAALEKLPRGSKKSEEDRQAKIRAAKQESAAIALRLLENEAAQQAAVAQQRQRQIEAQAQQFRNLGQQQQQSLERQLEQEQEISRAIESRQAVLAAQKNLQSALAGVAQAQYGQAIDLLEAQFTQEDRLAAAQEKRAELMKALGSEDPAQVQAAQKELAALDKQEQRERQVRELRLEAARAAYAQLLQQQALERQSLELEIQKTGALREQEKIRLAIEAVQARAATAQAQADLAKLQADKSATPEAIRAAELQIQAAQMRQSGVAAQEQALADQVGLDARLADNQRAVMNSQQQGQQMQARGAIAALTPEQADDQKLQAEALTQARAAAAELDTQFGNLAAVAEGLAKAMADTIQNLTGAAALPGRFLGGPVAAGQGYLVGEREPEVFVPGASGVVLNQRQIESNLGAFLAARSAAGVAPLRVPGVAGGRGAEGAVLAELQQLRAAVQGRRPQAQASFTFVNDANPDGHALDLHSRWMRQQIRGMGL